MVLVNACRSDVSSVTILILILRELPIRYLNECADYDASLEGKFP